MNTSVPVLIVGSGKLAAELFDNLTSPRISSVIPWNRKDEAPECKCIVVHAGSGRELQNVVSFCASTNSVLIELSTGGNIAQESHPFPIVICPNVNILMLKFMAMLHSHGHLFQEFAITVLESHQATKTSAPGTAITIARSLGLEADHIVSVRNPAVQENELKIPSAFLPRHAYHRIIIGDENVSITMETKVLGQAPYASGLARVIDGICERELEPKSYDILTLVQSGWI